MGYNKKKIRLYFTCPEHPIKNIVLALLNDKFEVTIDDKEPQYVIVQEYFYTNHNVIKDLLNRYNKAITIFYCGEALLPDFNFFDYAITFDRIDFGDRVMRIPTLDFFKSSVFFDIDKQRSYDEALVELRSKEYFCNFIYYNSEAHYVRDLIFKELSKYKYVHSLGKHLNNSNLKIGKRTDKNWALSSIEAKRKFKFSIAAENATYRGYTSEKLLTSKQANTIPIYFGNPDVGLDFNTKSFINYSDYDSLEDLIKYVQEVDKNDELYCEIANRPFRNVGQIEQYEYDSHKFKEMFFNIFHQDIKDAKRKGSGYWINIACNSIKRGIESIDEIEKLKINYEHLEIEYNVINNNYNDLIDKIAWWIPFSRLRKKFRNTFKSI